MRKIKCLKNYFFHVSFQSNQKCETKVKKKNFSAKEKHKKIFLLSLL